LVHYGIMDVLQLAVLDLRSVAHVMPFPLSPVGCLRDNCFVRRSIVWATNGTGTYPVLSPCVYSGNQSAYTVSCMLLAHVTFAAQKIGTVS
jgi:hypothetical protein